MEKFSEMLNINQVSEDYFTLGGGGGESKKHGRGVGGVNEKTL